MPYYFTGEKTQLTSWQSLNSSTLPRLQTIASEHQTHFTVWMKHKQRWGGKRDRCKTCSSSHLHSEVVELLVFVHLQECHCQPSLNALAEGAEPNIHVPRYKLKHWKQKAIIPIGKYYHEREQNKQQNSQGSHVLLSWSSGHIQWNTR